MKTTKHELVSEYLRTNGDSPTAEVARRLGVSNRHVRRVRAELIKGASAPPPKNNTPKILILDIETSPMQVLVWGLYKQRIPKDNIVKDWSILCWRAKWLFDDIVMGDYVTGNEARSREDGRILAGVHHLLNEADIVVAHNLLKFDKPRIFTRFIINGYGPIAPFHVVDTYQVARNRFSFSSASLDDIARVLGLARKIYAPYSLWYDSVIYGDEGAISQLFEYCGEDVNVLEEVYLALRPWAKSHPNYNLYSQDNEPVCPNCGSVELVAKGSYKTVVGEYNTFTCCSCGAIGRARFTNLSKEKRRSMIVPVAR